MGRNPTYDEAIYMARIKRRRAKEAMAEIIEANGVISNQPGPAPEVLLDYFVNMVYGIELLLKVLAKDWSDPKKNTRFSHRVDEMYEEIFGQPHNDSEFMRELRDAIQDQKFLCRPVEELVAQVEAIEDLWDELTFKYYQTEGGQISRVNIEINTGEEFGRYLQRNVGRFIEPKALRRDHMTREQKILWKRHQIEALAEEIERLETEEEVELAHDEMLRQLCEEQAQKVNGLTSMMGTVFHLRRTADIEFGYMEYMMKHMDLG